MAINPVIANLTKARIDPNSMERRMPVELMQGIMSLGNAIGGGISARKASKRKEEAQSMLKDISSSLYGDPSNYQSSMMSIADKRRMAGDDSGAIEAENLAALSASDPDSFLRELTEDQFFFAKQAGIDLNEYKRALGFGGEDDKNILKIREETRSSLRKTKDQLDSEASDISRNWGKINNLGKRIEAGDRMAVAPALISLVKIAEPGNAVLIGEMTAQLNAQDPYAAMGDVLMKNASVSDVASALSQKLDLLNPSNIKVEDLIGTAKVLLKSSVGSVQDRFGELEEMSSSELTPRGKASIYNESFGNRIRSLNTLGLSDEDKGAYEWAIDHPNDSRSASILSGLGY